MPSEARGDGVLLETSNLTCLVAWDISHSWECWLVYNLRAMYETLG